MSDKVVKTDAVWQQQLSPDAYRVTRQHGTEAPHSHPYNQEKSTGTYSCVCCGADLFSSGTKYDSGSGWPSFYEPVSSSAVTEHDDRSLLSLRTEIRCAQCEAHLGHVFPDGPDPTGQRYCMNGVALDFEKDGADNDTGSDA